MGKSNILAAKRLKNAHLPELSYSPMQGTFFFCSKSAVQDQRKKSMSNNQSKLFSFVRIVFELTLNIFLQLFMTYRYFFMKLSSRVTRKIRKIRVKYTFQTRKRLKWTKFWSKNWVQDHRKKVCQIINSNFFHLLEKCLN